MRFMEIVSRITGFNVPVFSIQWNPSEADRALARRVLTFMLANGLGWIVCQMLR